MNDFKWPNLASPEIVCGTFTYPEDAEDKCHKLAKLIKAARKTEQYGVFVEPYGNVYRVVVRDRLAAAKAKKARQEKRADKRAQGQENGLWARNLSAGTAARAAVSVLCSGANPSRVLVPGCSAAKGTTGRLRKRRGKVTPSVTSSRVGLTPRTRERAGMSPGDERESN